LRKRLQRRRLPHHIAPDRIVWIINSF